MRKISDAVEEIVLCSEMAQLAMKNDVLNFRAYAKQIIPEVEEITWKEANLGSVVVALSRLQKKLSDLPDLKPKVMVRDLNIKSPLSVITYEKNSHSTRVVQLLYSAFNAQTEYLVVTYGISEITIICSSHLTDMILEKFGESPQAQFNQVVGVTIGFDAAYLAEPNVIYTLLASLAIKRINIREIVSTHTTLTVIINEHDLSRALTQLRTFQE